MQVLPRWRTFLILNNPITQSTAAIGLNSFHSTASFFDKWKNKFDTDVGGDQRPPKNYIRYSVKQKRADTKKALKSILFKGGCSTLKPEAFPKIEAEYAEQLNKKSRIKPARQAKRNHNKKPKRKHRREDSYEDYDDNHDRFFHATCGKHGFSWTFKPYGTQFNWNENYSFNQRDNESRQGSGGGSFVLGTNADRKILGLPTAGSLKIDDVKAAFRSSALKWHPDKHQCSSKAEAEEKFKHCVDAYKSLCSTLD